MASVGETWGAVVRAGEVKLSVRSFAFCEPDGLLCQMDQLLSAQLRGLACITAGLTLSKSLGPPFQSSTSTLKVCVVVAGAISSCFSRLSMLV